jgi:hypothetical protein
MKKKKRMTGSDGGANIEVHQEERSQSRAGLGKSGGGTRHVTVDHLLQGCKGNRHPTLRETQKFTCIFRINGSKNGSL